MGRSAREGRQRRRGGEEGGAGHGSTRLLGQPPVCSRFAVSHRAHGGLQNPWGRRCRFYSAPCRGEGHLPTGREGDGPEDAAVIPMDPARPGTEPSRRLIHSGCPASSEAVRSVNSRGRAGVWGCLISSRLVPGSSLSHAQCCCFAFPSLPAKTEKNPAAFRLAWAKVSYYASHTKMES